MAILFAVTYVFPPFFSGTDTGLSGDGMTLPFLRCY